MSKLNGLARAEVTFKPICACGPCGRQAFSRSYRVIVETLPIYSLHEAVNRAMEATFIEPPVGWSVSGRDNFTCAECMANENAPPVQ